MNQKEGTAMNLTKKTERERQNSHCSQSDGSSRVRGRLNLPISPSVFNVSADTLVHTNSHSFTLISGGPHVHKLAPPTSATCPSLPANLHIQTSCVRHLECSVVTIVRRCNTI